MIKENLMTYKKVRINSPPESVHKFGQETTPRGKNEYTLVFFRTSKFGLSLRLFLNFYCSKQ